MRSEAKSKTVDTPSAAIGTEVPQVLFRLSRWENLEHAEEV